ncbi:MAG: hypothetical protein K2Y56_01305 [Methylobacterium sp.]|uniref:hypothetical protein n=1 Tax=Methylobacterium sp. TaxID=409 RepID=UPI0025D3B26C|nr:hypothetical protein [Methylobacterium sp.]MBX9930170.1 hypothetical protein [Methylobacterium sp.]
MNWRTAALALALGVSAGGADAASLYQNWYPNTPYVGPSQDYAAYQRYPGGFGYATAPRGADAYGYGGYGGYGYGGYGGYGAAGYGYGGGYQGISFGGYYETDYSNYRPPSYYTSPSADVRPYSYYNSQNNGRDYPASFYSGDGYDFNGHGPYSGYGTLGFRGISFNGGSYEPNAGLEDPASYQGGIYPSPNRYSQSIGSAQAARYGSPAYQGGFAVVPSSGYYAVAGGPLKRSQYYNDAVYTTLGTGFRPAGRAYDDRSAGAAEAYGYERSWRDVPRERQSDVRDAYPPQQRSALGPYPRGRMDDYLPGTKRWDDERLRRRVSRCSERTVYSGTEARTSRFCRPCNVYRADGYERTACGPERVVAKD